MSSIKTKDSKPKTVKILNKAVTRTQRVKDPIVYANEKSKDAVDNGTNINDYGDDKIKYASSRVMDDVLYAGKKLSYQTVEYAKKKYHKHKLYNSKNIATNDFYNSNKNIKISKNKIKNTEDIPKKLLFNNKTSIQKRNLFLNKFKKIVYRPKVAIKNNVFSIKGIIARLKSLVAILAAGTTLATIVIIIICLIGLLTTSIFGIFFSSENTSKDNMKMSDCISSLNKEMDNKIGQVISLVPHDEINIISNKAEWKDILSVYTVRISDGKQEVLTMNEEKMKILQEVFWDMNSISYEVKTELYESDAIGSLEIPDYINNGLDSPIPNEEENKVLTVLHIKINSLTLEDMKQKYVFDEIQNKELEELLEEKYSSLWNPVIYGVYGSSGEITDWKQKGKEWSNIKIGSTNSTIGDIGCLITSIAILIKKAEIPTKNIYPFNPGTFVIALNNNYGFDLSGNLRYNTISKIIPNFKYQGNINLRNLSKKEKLNKIKEYFELGYYIAVEVKGATENSQHWVAIDNISNSSVLILDPASNTTNMWERYDWQKTSQFVYFSAEK